jgi:hypothetical protein
MTASNDINNKSAIMDAVHAHQKFKWSAVRIGLLTVMKNVSHHQVIPIEI